MSVGGSQRDCLGETVVHFVNPFVEEWDVQKSVSEVESNVVNQDAKANLNCKLEYVCQILSFHQMGQELRVLRGNVKDN